MLTFLHISDVHLKREYGKSSVYDLDADLRSALNRDLKQLHSVIGGFDGLLLGGDIAFRGHADEYARARGWINELNELCELEPSNTWVVPGNHDVDRSIAESFTIKQYREFLRTCPENEIDGNLEQLLLHDAAARHSFLTPLSNYNDFASAYGCDISVDQPFWEARLSFSQRLNLVIRGVTSPLISDQNDEPTSFPLVVGHAQALLGQNPDEVQMVLCHHPPSWIRQGAILQSIFDLRSRVQLYGHEHSFGIQTCQTSVRIGAGAIHPGRDEGTWDPRYNIIQLDILNDGGSRPNVEIRVYSRAWNSGAQRFVSANKNGMEVENFIFAVLPDLPPEPTLVPAVIEPANDLVEDVQGAPSDKTHRRHLVYDFVLLPYVRRMEIAGRLNLLREEDAGVEVPEWHRRIFRRAVELGVLSDLWHEVRLAQGRATDGNPFS
jgi:calcineurin-like phosphoesterase family protein